MYLMGDGLKLPMLNGMGRTDRIDKWWAQPAVIDGIFQRSSMDVVIFRDQEVNDFFLIDSKINYNFDMPPSYKP